LGQEIDGISLLQWHMRLLEPSEISEAIVVAGHLGEQVSDLATRVNPHGLSLRVIHEQEQKGTVAALALAAQHTDNDEFLVILGDILMSMPIQQFLNDWRASGANVAVVVHPSTHPEDSDAAFPSHDGSVIVVPKSEPRDHIPNMSSAGLFAITREGIARYGNLRDVGSDLLPAAASKGDLSAFISSHYLKDTGTPQRLSATQDDVARGALARRGQLTPRRALFLDRDGVINPSTTVFHKPDHYELLPGVGESIREANQRGVPTVVVTNQPAIAKGFMTFEEHQRIRAKMDRLLGAHGAFVDDYLFCPHHPDAGFEGEIIGLKIACDCRKPAISMAHLAQARHSLELSGSVMVGDTDRDRGFAKGAGMHFIHVTQGCEAIHEEECYPQAEEAIRRGIEVVTC
jgi:histidinol-phosphate phosphatase family protein